MLPIFLMTLVIVVIAISLIAIRMIVKPGADFQGTCASRNVSGDKGCPCGRKPGEACESTD